MAQDSGIKRVGRDPGNLLLRAAEVEAQAPWMDETHHPREGIANGRGRCGRGLGVEAARQGDLRLAGGLVLMACECQLHGGESVSLKVRIGSGTLFLRFEQQTFRRELTATAAGSQAGRPQHLPHRSLKPSTDRVRRRLLHARQRDLGG